MLEVASEKLTARERECLKHFRQAREGELSFAGDPAAGRTRVSFHDGTATDVRLQA